MNNVKQVFLEKELLDNEKAKAILDHFTTVQVKIIERYDEVFGKVKKPYLQKRKSLNLFVAKKRGNLVKEAPEAYGTKNEKHFYFIHAFNCVYECEYCYLQGYFHSPDLVLFINHEDIIKEIEVVASKYRRERIWFHAGEFSDSLALTHITGELNTYFNFFKKNPHLIMELRTKSDNIETLLQEEPTSNIITSYSLSPRKNIDYKAPDLKKRVDAIKRLYEKGFPIGIHLDPIIPFNNYLELYEDLILSLSNAIPLAEVQYFSLGVTRFPEKIFHQVKQNYPNSMLFKEEFLKDKNGIVRSPKPTRFPIMENIKRLLLENGAHESKVYLCME